MSRVICSSWFARHLLNPPADKPIISALTATMSSTRKLSTSTAAGGAVKKIKTAHAKRDQPDEAEAPSLPLELEAMDVLLKFHATSAKHNLLDIRECGRLSIANKTVAGMFDDNGVWKHIFDEAVKKGGGNQRGADDIIGPIVDAYEKQKLSRGMPDCFLNPSKELIERVGYKNLAGCLRGKSCTQCDKMTGYANSQLFERICNPCKKALTEKKGGPLPMSFPIGTVYKCKDCDRSGSFVNIMLHERLEHGRDLFGYAQGAPPLQRYSGPKDLAKRHEIPGITGELQNALSGARFVYEKGTGRQGLDDEADEDYGAEMTTSNCLISFDIPNEGVEAGPSNEVVTITVDHYEVMAEECSWGGLNVCSQFGSGKVPIRILRLGLGEESGIIDEANARRFGDVLEKLGLVETNASQLLATLLASALPLAQIKAIGDDNYFVDENEMPVFSGAMDILTKKVACQNGSKGGDVIDLTNDSEEEEGGDDYRKAAADEVIVID